MLDPLVDLVLRTALAALFAWSAVHKLRDLGAFATIVRGYSLFPHGTEHAAAAALAVVELAVATAFLPSSGRLVASASGAMLLSVYTVAIAINLARGRRDVDCGCLGPARRQALSEWLLLRNATLIAGALATGLPVDSRGLVWLDRLTGLAAVVALALLWGAANQLLSQWPQMKALRRPA